MLIELLVFSDKLGAAACIVVGKLGGQTIWQRRLSDTPRPTIQSVELAAIILGLEAALEKCDELIYIPHMDVKIYTNSRYALNCMTAMKARWIATNFTTSVGRPVAHQELVREAYALQERLEQRGRVEYVWIPKERNTAADAEVYEILSQMAEE